MTQAKLRFETFEAYLSYADEGDRLYELFNGELIEVPPESGENTSIAIFLTIQLAAIVGHLRVRPHGLELEVRGEPRNRYPDLTVIREEHVEQLQRRNTIRLLMAPPELVVEVVSPGEVQHDRDYVAKRGQYQDRGIPEYWLVDPSLQTITILVLQDQGYVEAGVFRGGDRMASPQFRTLDLTAEQVLAAGK